MENFDLTNFFLPGLFKLQIIFLEFPVGLGQVYGLCQQASDDWCTNTEREIAAISADLCLKIVKNWI